MLLQSDQQCVLESEISLNVAQLVKWLNLGPLWVVKTCYHYATLRGDQTHLPCLGGDWAQSNPALAKTCHYNTTLCGDWAHDSLGWHSFYILHHFTIPLDNRSLDLLLTYRQNVWKDIDKCRKACYVKCCKCALPAIHKILCLLLVLNHMGYDVT